MSCFNQPRFFHCIALVFVLFLLPTLVAETNAQPTPTTIAQRKSYRLQMRANNFNGQGIVIRSVTPGGASQNLTRADDSSVRGSLEPSDRIVAIDGMQIRNLQDYYQAMRKSQNGRIRMTVVDKQTGQPFDWYAQAVEVSENANTMRFRLGFKGEPASDGLRINEFEPNSPMLQLFSTDGASSQGYAELGDTIVAINGQRIASSMQYFAIMNQVRDANQMVRVSIKDVNGGAIRDWLVKPQLKAIADSTNNGKREIHLLFLGLTNDPTIGEGERVNLKIVSQVFSDNVSNSFIASKKVLSGNDCTARSILNAVKRIDAKPQDTIFCFFGTHGAYDSNRAFNDPSNGHFFSTAGQDLMRKDLLGEMLDRKARLTVLITETCNAKAVAQPIERTVSEARQSTVTGFTSLEKLLLFQRGIVDISATSKDEYGWINRNDGGWFTQIFFKHLQTSQDWLQLLQTSSLETNQYFQEKLDFFNQNPDRMKASNLKLMRDQRAQTATAFQLSVTRDDYSGEPPTGTRSVPYRAPRTIPSD